MQDFDSGRHAMPESAERDRASEAFARGSKIAAVAARFFLVFGRYRTT